MSLKFPWPMLGRITVTVAAVAAAGAVGWHLWQHYEVEPWTRDGRIRADVIQVAPDVTGQVTAVFVHDNQRVDAGQPLFEIDRARFELALRQAESAAQAQTVALAQAEREAHRNRALGDLVAQEATEQGQSHVEQARAALAQAVVNRDLAKLNLARTRVQATANAIVTNLDLQAGTYVTAGHPVMALVDHDSFYAEGYFEETKLASIHVGDPVSVSLMGVREALSGHVASFAGGIADRDRSTATNLLPNVNPTFNWVRLAQRIPVRVALDRVPDAIRLVAGQTVTVDVRSRAATAVKTQ
ncbi:MAG: HlyD family secretion protein [Massilia sp.]|nr:HlyD family secretion protein [Massilia sp.]